MADENEKSGEQRGEPEIVKRGGGPNASTEGRDQGWSDAWAGRTGIPEGSRDRATKGELYTTLDHQHPPGKPIEKKD